MEAKILFFIKALNENSSSIETKGSLRTLLNCENLEKSELLQGVFNRDKKSIKRLADLMANRSYNTFDLSPSDRVDYLNLISSCRMGYLKSIYKALGWCDLRGFSMFMDMFFYRFGYYLKALKVLRIMFDVNKAEGIFSDRLLKSDLTEFIDFITEFMRKSLREVEGEDSLVSWSKGGDAYDAAVRLTERFLNYDESEKN